MACAAIVRIGPAKQTFWALHMRDGSPLRERTRLLPRSGEVILDRGTLRIEDRGVRLELALAEDAGFEARCANGSSYVWTRKQAGIAARGTLTINGGLERQVDALAVIDDTLGYHSRHTEWHWSAGVGLGPDGSALAWNLVSGVNDPPTGSERAVWQDGQPQEAAPVSFTADLSSLRCQDGSELQFRPEAERSRHDNLLLLASDYRAPFGTFSGLLPGGIELAQGLGVMEHHRARW